MVAGCLGENDPRLDSHKPDGKILAALAPKSSVLEVEAPCWSRQVEEPWW